MTVLTGLLIERRNNMLICDLCRKRLDGKITYMSIKNGSSHICEECVKICRIIVKDPNTQKITYLNEYKEKLDREGKI